MVGKIDNTGITLHVGASKFELKQETGVRYKAFKNGEPWYTHVVADRDFAFKYLVTRVVAENKDNAKN